MSLTLDDIRAAARAIAGHVIRTPCLEAPALSERLGTRIVLKPESLQHTGSFKARGALNRMLGLDARERAAGVVAASAGNHAQGVAFHANRLGIPATVVMPRGTPFNKVGRTEALGARVVLEGADLAEAEAHAHTLAERDRLAFVHPYDDLRIVAGQGTIALEMLEDIPEIDDLVVPIGGGGLIAGIATVAKALRPGIRIHGVQAATHPHAVRALGRPVPETAKAPPPGGATLAEGIAVKRPGTVTLPLVAALTDVFHLVSETALENAVQEFIDRQRLVVEGAGAAPLAAVAQTPETFAGRTVGLVVSGGNIDARLLASVLMRGLVRDGRMARLRIELSDSPGALARVAGLIGEAGGNIVEVHHRRLFYDVPIKLAEVDVVVETRDRTHVARLVSALTGAGFPTRLLAGTAVDNPG